MRYCRHIEAIEAQPTAFIPHQEATHIKRLIRRNASVQLHLIEGFGAIIGCDQVVKYSPPPLHTSEVAADAKKGQPSTLTKRILHCVALLGRPIPHVLAAIELDREARGGFRVDHDEVQVGHEPVRALPRGEVRNSIKVKSILQPYLEEQPILWLGEFAEQLIGSSFIAVHKKSANRRPCLIHLDIIASFFNGPLRTAVGHSAGRDLDDPPANAHRSKATRQDLVDSYRKR